MPMTKIQIKENKFDTGQLLSAAELSKGKNSFKKNNLASNSCIEA